MKSVVLFLALSFLFYCCDKPEEESFTAEGMAPIYIDGMNESLIKSVEPIPFGTLGAIVERGSFIYICEIGKGIHVVDNTDPASPKNIRFWEIPGVSIFTLNATRLYADNSLHLWVIDITDIHNIFVIDIEEDVYLDNTTSLVLRRPPLDYTGYFECVNQENGVVINWEMKLLDSPQCNAY